MWVVVIVFRFVSLVRYLIEHMEIELRAKIDNVNDIHKLLLQQGAIEHGVSKVKDYYFGYIPLYRKLGHSFWIRVRKKGDSVYLAYKGSTGKDGVYEEYETECDNLKNALSICRSMGLEEVISVEKVRRSYSLGEVNAEIDDFGKTGKFLELEVIGEEINKDVLFRLFMELGVSKDSVFEKGYITLFLQEKNSPYTKWIKN